MTKQNYIKVWEECLQIIKDNIPQESYNAWFASIKAVSLENSVLTLEVPSDGVREVIEAKFIKLLSSVLRRVIGPNARLIYNVRIIKDKIVKIPYQSSEKIENREMSLPGEAAEFMGNPYLIPGIKKMKIDPQLNPIYTFENFIEGECNCLGRAAGLSIAANPGRNTFNPLFIYGGPGLGKTHLAQAIGIEIKKNFPEKIILYVSANRFLTQFMDAAGVNNKMTDFLRFYQSLDVLIIDDVHEFSGKKGTQNAFFQIFNYLHQSGKQLVLTSDRPPVELSDLDQRLLSRFKWGLSVELLPPDYDTRLAILKDKSFREGVDVPQEVLEFIANKVRGNVRELEGLLFSLVANATFAKKSMTLELASELIGKIVKETRTEITVDHIQDVICDYFKITPEMFLSKTRKREIVQARQIAMYLSRNHTKTSLASIGMQIGGKDHSTVLHACMTVADLISTDRTFKQYVSDIEKKLQSNN